MYRMSPRKRTKREMALELYELHHPYLSNENMVNKFIRELNLPSVNSARTYISFSKKSLASKLQIHFRQRKIDTRKTKRGRAMDIFNKNKHLTRKEMMELFVVELNMTQNSAATHCSMCVAEYVGSKHKAIA